jgi:hypothetical protein
MRLHSGTTHFQAPAHMFPGDLRLIPFGPIRSGRRQLRGRSPKVNLMPCIKTIHIPLRVGSQIIKNTSLWGGLLLCTSKRVVCGFRNEQRLKLAQSICGFDVCV